MPVSALEKILEVDRTRRFMGKNGEFAEPVLHERPASSSEGPFVSSTSKGNFVRANLRPEGTVWAAFFDCPLGEEPHVLLSLYRSLWALSSSQGWPNRAGSIQEGANKMRGLGLEPKSVVSSTVEEGPLKSYVCDALPEGCALVTSLPSLVGGYARTGDFLAISLKRANNSIVLVGPPREVA
jgi:hypothetical protein